MKIDFYYECEICKEKIPANWDNIHPQEMTTVTVDFGKKTEITFRCENHKKD